MRNNTFLQSIQRKFSSPLVVVLVAALLMWAMGIPFLANYAGAAALTSVKDTLSDSDLTVVANHTVSFVSQSVISASSTIVLDFADEFQSTSSPAFASSDADDYDIASTSVDLTMRVAGGCTGAAGLAEFEITSIDTSNVFTFTHCNGTDDVASGATIEIEIGTNATAGATGDSQLVNPGKAQSYIVKVTAPTADTADLRVAIIDDVTVTASVDTSLTFTIAGVSSGGAPANGQQGDLSITTTAIAIPFGTLTVDATSTARQDLTVTTNATNGFTVTLQFDQALTSSTGADIDLFKDGSGESTPTAYTAPLGTLNDELTYGHLGFTSADDLNASEYGTALYAGNGTTTARAVFENNGPADGSTANVGATEIGFIIEVTALQEAGTDYTAQLTYVATPTF